MPGDITTGLISWWKFDENDAGPCAGAVVIDSAGNSGLGNGIGSILYNPGAVGEGCLAAKVGGHVEIPYSGALQLGTGDLTLCGWVRSAVKGSSSWYLMRRYVGNLPGLSLIWDATHGQITAKLNTRTLSGAWTDTGDWTFISVSRTAATATLWGYSPGFGMIGIASAPAALTINVGSSDIVYMGYQDVNDNKGSWDDVRIYNRALATADYALLVALRNPAPVSTRGGSFPVLAMEAGLL